MLCSLHDHTPIANAKPIRTADYSVELQRSGPAVLPALYHNMHMVMVCLSGRPFVVRSNGREERATPFSPGESSIHASGPGDRVTWPLGMHCLYVHLHPRLVRRVGQSVHRSSSVVLATRHRLRDVVIRDIGLQLYDFVGRAALTGDRDVRDLVLALAHHVVVGYAAEEPATPHIGTLSIEEALDAFREDTLDWKGVSALAARAGLTRSHFSRRIQALIGVSPHRLVLGSRVEAAKHLLSRRDTSLSEVAYATGFSDQSHLTRVFKKFSGVTPAAFRASHCIGDTIV